MNILIASANLKVGGAQRVAANIAKYAPDDFQFFNQVFEDEGGEYQSIITAKGHKIGRTPAPQTSILRYIISTAKVIRKEQIDVVHSHNMYASGLLMFIAWFLGVPGRISHSHTSKDEVKPSFFRMLYKKYMRHLIRFFSTDYIACGFDAGKELYGEHWFRKRGIIVNNGIDIEAYRFDAAFAQEMRSRYHLEGKFVLGHVGHYAAVKNQSFLLSLLPAILEKRPETMLIMFGEGDGRESLARIIRERKLEDHAVLAGNSNEINKVLSAFDVFLFPSLFEGTPLALIEAQANSLPCIVSSNIPPDAILTNLVRQIPLDDPSAWIREILCASRDTNCSGAAQLMENYETVEKSMQSIYSIYRKYER